MTETTFIPYALNGLLLPAGRVYVADRQSDRTGKVLWCPDMDEHNCIDWLGDALILQPQTILPVGPLPVPPGAVEEFRLR